MANQPESATYDAGVYQLEVIDPVQGGVGGKSNSPLLNLANRTAYLKAHIDALEAGTFIPPTVAPINSPTFTGTPAGPTAAAADDSTKFATTRFVNRLNSDVAAVTGLTNANVTLTSGQYGCGIITLAGTLTGNINIVFPNNGKWVVANNTTGAFTITLKTTSGTGILVKQGKSVPIAADGTNVIRQDSDLDNLDLTGNPTAPTQAGGDVSTKIATTAFVGSATAAGVPYRNRIDNGDMGVQLRNETNFFTDRYATRVSGSGQAGTFFLSNNVPNASFPAALGFTVTTSGAPAGSDQVLIRQTLIGKSTADWVFGTASAKQLYLSFWVKASVTGTFGVTLRNAAGTRSFVQSYAINATNTWEYKTISVPGDTTGTWNGYNDAASMILTFDLGVGASVSSGTVGSWQAGNYVGLTGGTKIIGQANGTNISFTGIQLEAGNVATAFEKVPYDEMVRRCQRFYRKFSQQYRNGFMDGNSAEYPTVFIDLDVPMVAVPTLRIYGWGVFYYNNGSGAANILHSGGTPTFGGGSLGGSVFLANASNAPGNAQAGKSGEWAVGFDFDAEP